MADPENKNARYFRTADRIFRVNEGWFFASREGDLGPFTSREKAEIEADRYVQRAIDSGLAPLTLATE